jgi:uncharacterized Ntn-hydrolase superfamily protein
MPTVIRDPLGTVAFCPVLGRAASFTDAHCFDWAGDRQGLNCAAQGNTQCH